MIGETKIALHKLASEKTDKQTKKRKKDHTIEGEYIREPEKETADTADKPTDPAPDQSGHKKTINRT